MPEGIISLSGTQHGLIITNSGAALVSTQELSPTNSAKNNPAMKLEYSISGTATGITTGSQIGIISQITSAGSSVKLLTYSNDNLINVGSWV